MLFLAAEFLLELIPRASFPWLRLSMIAAQQPMYIRSAALEIGKYLGCEPIFAGESGQDAYLSDASAAIELFGYPTVSIKTLLRWQAEWILDGGRALGKPTHFEERKGSY